MILRVLGGAAVIALLVIGWLSVNDERIGPAPAAVRAKRLNPGYAAQNAVLIETGPDGRPMYTLHASEIREQPTSQAVRLLDVTLEFRDPHGGVWNGRANEGLVSSGAAHVALSGAVTLTGALPESTAPLSISTDRLAVDTRSDVVTTTDPVVLEWNGEQVSARGLVAQLKDQRVTLESDVHGHYHP